MNDPHALIAAWMLQGGLKSPDPARDRNRDHLRALKASRSTSPGLVSRLVAAVKAVRTTATVVDPARSR